MSNVTLLKLFCLSNKYRPERRLNFFLGNLLGREVGFILRRCHHQLLKYPGREMLLPQQAVVKRWSFVLDPGSDCLLSPWFVLSVSCCLPSISFFSWFLLLSILFLYFPPLLPWIPPNSWVGRVGCPCSHHQSALQTSEATSLFV